MEAKEPNQVIKIIRDYFERWDYPKVYVNGNPSEGFLAWHECEKCGIGTYEHGPDCSIDPNLKDSWKLYAPSLAILYCRRR